MGQIKNIKLHIVTDIKCDNTKTCTRWCTAKCGFLIQEVMVLAAESVVCVPTNMASFENTGSLFADSVSVNMPTISDSESSSNKKMYKMFAEVEATTDATTFSTGVTINVRSCWTSIL